MRVFVSLPKDLMAFVDEKVSSGVYATRSDALIHAIDLMRQAELQKAYEMAFTDLNSVWDLALADGIGDEQW